MGLVEGDLPLSFFIFSYVPSPFFFLLIFHSNLFHYQHYLVRDVSSLVGAPWRCGVLTTQDGKAGIGLGHPLGREHDSTLHSGVDAPRLLKRSVHRLDYCCCCFGRGTETRCLYPQVIELIGTSPR